MTTNDIQTRVAVESDFEDLERLEQEVWGKFGTAVFTRQYFEIWRQIHPEGFIIAKTNDELIAYIYFQRTNFSPDETAPIKPYLVETDMAKTVSTHLHDGKSAHVVSICSKVPGGGRNLMLAMEQFLFKNNLKYAYGGVRIPGFKRYLKNILQSGSPKMSRAQINRLATSYIVQTAQICKNQLGPKLKDFSCENTPPLTQPDPSLGSLLNTYTKITLLELLSEYMPDPFSLNFAGLICYENSLFKS